MRNNEYPEEPTLVEKLPRDGAKEDAPVEGPSAVRPVGTSNVPALGRRPRGTPRPEKLERHQASGNAALHPAPVGELGMRPEVPMAKGTYADPGPLLARYAAPPAAPGKTKPQRKQARPPISAPRSSVHEPITPAPRAKKSDSARPTKTEARPAKTEARPAKTEARPTRTEARPTRTEARPTRTEAPALAAVRPEPPKPLVSKPVPVSRRTVNEALNKTIQAPAPMPAQTSAALKVRTAPQLALVPPLPPAPERKPPPEPELPALSREQPAPQVESATHEPTEEERWGVFERLGLGPNAVSRIHSGKQKFFVAAYRALGFVILTVIVVVLIGYLATSAFYFISNSWVQPMVVSPSDQEVLQLNTKLTEQENLREGILASIQHTERVIATEERFQNDFTKAVNSDLSSRKDQLDRLRRLVGRYSRARQSIQATNEAFAEQSKVRTAAEFSAGLIDSDDFVSRKYQLAQIANSNLTLAERAASIANNAEELEVQSKALASVIESDDEDGPGPLSYDVLQIKRQYEESRLRHAKASEELNALKSNLARHDAIIDGIRQSPYLRAAERKATIAFVPYDNLDSIEIDAPLFGCELEMIVCDKVGKVVEVLPGEVSFKHPHREELVRGQMIEIELDDEDSAYRRVLFSGGKPLLL